MKKLLIILVVLLVSVSSLFAFDFAVGLNGGVDYAAGYNDESLYSSVDWSGSACLLNAKVESWIIPYLGVSLEGGFNFSSGLSDALKNAKYKGGPAFNAKFSLLGGYPFGVVRPFAKVGVGFLNRSLYINDDTGGVKTSGNLTINDLTLDLGLGNEYSFSIKKGEIVVFLGMDVNIPLYEKIITKMKTGSTSQDSSEENKDKSGVYLTTNLGVMYRF